MKQDSLHRMLSMLAKGKHPDASALGVSPEEYVKLVSDAVSSGYISGVYISFCDNANSGNLLSGAMLTEKGTAEARKGQSLFAKLFSR